MNEAAPKTPAPIAALAAGLLMLAATGCATPPTPSPSVQTPAPTPAPAATGSTAEAPPDLDPEALIGALNAYAADHADEFGGLYMHPPGSGSFVLLFTANLEEHAVALREISERVTVRPAEFTEAELLAVLEGLDLSGLSSETTEPISASLDTIGNRVTLEVKSSDPTLEVRLETLHAGRLDVIVHPLPGAWANVTEGDGWRLVATGRTDGNEAYNVRAATRADSWEALWLRVGLDGEPPAVDLGDEVVVSFAHGIGSSCPELRLDGVSIGGGVVYSVTSDPLAPRACTADLAAAIVFVVVLERTALPPDGFTLRLQERPVCGGNDCGFSEEIEVALP